MSDTQKQQTFIKGPMKDKPVNVLPGVGEAIGSRLTENGFDKAYKILGQFLILGKDEKKFTKWLEEIGRGNGRQHKLCFEALRDWCNEFL